MDSSHNSEECDALYKTERLDALEKGLYEQVKKQFHFKIATHFLKCICGNSALKL